MTKRKPYNNEQAREGAKLVYEDGTPAELICPAYPDINDLWVVTRDLNKDGYLHDMNGSEHCGRADRQLYIIED